MARQVINSDRAKWREGRLRTGLADSLTTLLLISAVAVSGTTANGQTTAETQVTPLKDPTIVDLDVETLEMPVDDSGDDVEKPADDAVDDPTEDNDDPAEDSIEPELDFAEDDFQLPPLEEFAAQKYLVPGPPPATLTLPDPVVEATSNGEQPEVTSSASFRNAPAAITRIDAATIWSSGARNLNELLDIYVPNVQLIRHNFGMDRLGTRGIIKDRDDSYLLAVNGRVMNHRSQEGAMSERDLPMLGDIHHIDFVRGPGAAIYGPGAVAGVINIVTHNGLTFSGTDATVRQGFVEGFTSVELRHGHQFNDDTGMMLYYGYSDYAGADQDDAPYKFGSTFTPRGGGAPVPAGQGVPFDINDDYQSYRSQGKHKIHAHLTRGEWDTWLRYTTGGTQTPSNRNDYAETPIGRANPGDSLDDIRATQFGYSQFTAFAERRQKMNDCWSLEYRFSYDIFDFQRIRQSATATPPVRSHREDEFYTRVLSRWTPNERHAAAVGVAYSWERFGLRSPGFPNAPAATQRQPNVTPWSTDTVSFLAEYQWKPSDAWAFFIGARTDDHTYTDILFSPRIAAVFTPNDRDTFKAIVNRSSRRSGDDELRAEFLSTGTFSDVENIEALELRHERQQTESLWLAMSAFGQDVGIVARDSSIERNVLLGSFSNWGLEFEAVYRDDCTTLVASHSYTKLASFNLVDPSNIQGLSSSPYGFGDELANWSPNLTKLYAVRKLNPCWSLSSSLRVYWGFPGAEDQADHNAQIFSDTGLVNGSLGYVDPGNDDPFGANVYLNFGLERRFARTNAIRLDLFNTLGWIDIDLNKRNYVLRPSEYRDHAPAVALSARFDY